MSETPVQTKSLKLIQKTLAEVRAWVDAMDPSEEAHLFFRLLANNRVFEAAMVALRDCGYIGT